MILKTFRLGLASLSLLHLIVLGLSVVISCLILGNPLYSWPFAYGLGFLFLVIFYGFFPSADARQAQTSSYKVTSSRSRMTERGGIMIGRVELDADTPCQTAIHVKNAPKAIGGIVIRHKDGSEGVRPVCSKCMKTLAAILPADSE
jgi:hypothetical protein